MKYDKYKIIKLNVLDEKLLKDEYGYDPKNYYVGPWAFMNFLTKLRNILRKRGVKFPFNTCAFKHDMLYNIGGSVWWKMRVDFVFFCDMIKVINARKDLEPIRNKLILRALIFYLVVLLATPIYIWKKNWKLRKQ